jgi:hypothetical protein
MVSEDSLPGLIAISDIDGLINGIQIDILRHMAATKAEEKRAFEDDIGAQKQSVRKLMDEYEKTIHLDEDRQNFKKLQEAGDNYEKAYGPLMELSRQPRSQRQGWRQWVYRDCGQSRRNPGAQRPGTGFEAEHRRAGLGTPSAGAKERPPGICVLGRAAGGPLCHL